MNSMEYVKWNAGMFVENIKAFGMAILATIKGVFLIFWSAITSVCAIVATIMCLVIALAEHGMEEIESRKRAMAERSRGAK